MFNNCKYSIIDAVKYLKIYKNYYIIAEKI